VTLLEIKNVTKLFGGLRAVDNVSLEVTEKELVGLIGPNGSGKTTLVNCIAGFYHPDDGDVFCMGENITRLRPHQIAARGLTRTFQAIPFPMRNTVTVLEYVMVGLHLKIGVNLAEAVARTRGGNRKENIARDIASETLDFMGLTSQKDTLYGSLNNYSRRCVSLAIALVSKPSLLLIDEIVAGMSAEETAETMELIRKVRHSGVTILLIEHNMRVIMGLCDRIVVLNFGVKIAEGTPAETAANKEVQKAYLGEV
jgi:branched-chain amino acid transport system ATP-binding protein